MIVATLSAFKFEIVQKGARLRFARKMHLNRFFFFLHITVVVVVLVVATAGTTLSLGFIGFTKCAKEIF